ncbi:hypothetical protein BEH_07845 [Priestia filamentosa]|uniref:Uncharacterized protein n=1 Tax=Priestia filamentosa TaxID=1402861 RepID=A0A0H4KGT7_9BACI|nr:AAA family ATPase [Priestia filamentosa]AKO92021.1 hypothetical protein BEH_07845 [Priestia filamentosa]
MTISFRKPAARKQGLKILAYGENGAGKSLFTLSFPNNAIVDSESKIGVYENDPEYKDNIVGVADTANYYDVIKLSEQVVKNPTQFNTYTIDSYTNIYNGMQVSAMESEEERARKKKGNVDDATVSQRGWGKVKLNTIRFDSYIAQASAKGITVIAVAHKDDVMQDANGKAIKVGEKPSLRKNAEHTFDVIIRFYKEKDMVTQEWKFFAEVEKDTTKTYKLGTKLENVTYEAFKGYIERSSKAEGIETNYDKVIESTVSSMQEESANHDELVVEFKALYKELSAKDEALKGEVAKILKSKGAEKYNDPSLATNLKEAIEEIKKLK